MSSCFVPGSHRASRFLPRRALLAATLFLGLLEQVSWAAPTVDDTRAPVRSRAAPKLSVQAVEREPARKRPSAEELATLRRGVEENPALRKARFELSHALLRAGDLQAAHREAEAWREHDAYNLVVVRMLGDIESELGDRERARRTYSAIVELLPKDVEARRALSTVLKQAGDLQAARAELVAALALAPNDARTQFELGDVEQRLGMQDSARTRFETTKDAADAPESLRYPARQRLAQIHAQKRLEAGRRGDTNQVHALGQAIDALQIHGGTENDIKVYLSWDSDRTDVDLWVLTPSGEKVFYAQRQGKGGEALFDDVTTGYGPESFTAPHAEPGTYRVQVNYFGSRASTFKEARGEVTVILNEGRATEQRSVFPYRLFEEKDTLTVADIRVEAKP
ncbi:MAG TPA: DUF2135 domain-containing protein [Polyangiaceae bacterium]|nr:DUF2135 domain-containing protein [Polyangiaceae bacterium]